MTPFDLVQSLRNVPGLSSGARNVLHCLAGYADRETRVCWPSVATLSQGTGLSERQVQRHLRTLQAAGHIHILQPGSGRGHRTRYRLQPRETTTPASPIPAQRVTPETKKGRHGCREKGVVDVTRTIMEQPEGTPKPGSVFFARGSYSTPFLDFWSRYPRKEAKGAAWRAWQFLNPAPPLPLLLQALDRQRRSETWRQDGGKYIPHPATWLHARRWEDEPPDPGPKPRLRPPTRL